MEGLRGVEPPTTWFVARCSIQLSYRPAETARAFPLDYDTLPATSTAPRKSNSPTQQSAVHLLERAVGIEPTFEAWKASVLPLYDARSDHQRDYTGMLQNSG